jgi:endonuclease YncB( thermonuclease family)
LQIGTFPLADDPVVDGDTIRVQGIEGSIRLLSIDTEEKLHSQADRAAANENFEEYLQRKRGSAVRPSKTGTPMGEEATGFARSFFADAELVRLERDDPKNIRGHYGRLLAYAFVKKDGRWTSYNVECVRAGMSPYFTKYGYSHRFHNQFSHAEAEARKAQRGIWSPSAEGYGDYEERKAWWNARADFIRAFEHEANARDGYIPLANWDAARRLEDRLDHEVNVLSTVTRIQHFKGLVRVSLAWTHGNAFPVIFFDEDVFRQSEIERYKQEPVTVRGTVERYEKGDYRTLQIVVRSPDQVGLPSLPWPGNAN